MEFKAALAALSIVAIQPMLSACANVAAPTVAAEASKDDDHYIGQTKWVNPKFPVYLCISAPEAGSTMGRGCKPAQPGTALTIVRRVTHYKFDIPIHIGYEVADSAGTVGFINSTDPIMMLDEKERRQQADVKKDCERRGGVSVGMTRGQVYASCWGKPKSINDTLTARGKHEQWVYGGGYVYLDDGVVTSIQTSH